MITLDNNTLRLIHTTLLDVVLQADKKAEAARRSKQRAADEAAAPATPASKDNPGELRVTQVGGKPTVCGTRTKAGDLIEFRYVARQPCVSCEPCVPLKWWWRQARRKRRNVVGKYQEGATNDED